MMKQRAFLILLTGILIGSLGTAQAQDSQRLGEIVLPTHQLVELTLDAREAGYSGRVTIDLNVVSATDRFSLHAEGMEFSELALSNAQNATVPVSHSVSGDLLHVLAEENLAQGSYQLTIAFSRAFDTQATGLYRMEMNGESYAFTQFEADDARQAFPCFDEPNFKFPYQMILTAPMEHMAVSNMSVLEETTDGTWRTTTFKTSPPMPSYLLALATGPLEAVTIPDMPIPSRVLTVQGQSHLAGTAIEMSPPLLKALADYFGQPYPYDKLDLLAVPEYMYGAMENPGAVTFADRILLIDPEASSPAQRATCAAVIAHEFAHFWFGDLVTMDWWDDLWLNESFASWLGDKVTHQVYPEFRMDVKQLRAANQAFQRDTQVSTRAIRQPVKSMDSLLQSADVLAYNKGQAVLNMLEHSLGEVTFRDGVLAYINDHAWGNTVGEDLWRAFSGASGTLEVTAIMASFLDQPGVPVVTVEPLPQNRIRVSQERFLNHGASVEGNQLWRIPMVMKIGLEDGSSFQHAFLLERPTQTLTLDTEHPIAWVHPNAEQRGYYRWNVPGTMMVAMAKNIDRLTAPERIGYLDNLRSLVGAGRVNGEDYLRTLSQFSGDADAEVVRALLSGLASAHGNLVLPDSREDFAVYVRHTLNEAKQRFGLEAQEGEPETVTMFRPQLFGLLGGMGKDDGVRSFAMTLAEAYMADPASIDPSLAPISLSLAARGGNSQLFEEMQSRFETTEVPRERPMYLTALGNFEDPALCDRALDYCLNGPLRPQELRYIPTAVGRTSEDEDIIWNWLRGNYPAITGKIPPMFRIYMPYFAMGCTQERIDEIHAFFKDHMVPGMDKEIATVTEGIGDCAGLRDREGGTVSTYLRQFNLHLKELGDTN